MIKKIFLVFLIYISSVSIILSQAHQIKKFYIADTVSSEIGWFCGKHYGCVHIDTGMVIVQNKTILGGNFIIDLNTVYDDDITENDLLRLTLNNVIKSKVFFNVKTYPYAKFTIDKIYKLDSDRYIVSGELELQNKINYVNFNCRINFNNDILSVYSDIFSIDRTQWNINYLSEKFDPEGKETMYVPDKIDLVIRFYAILKNED